MSSMNPPATGVGVANPCVFLSYAGPQREYAAHVRDQLKSHGIRIVMDDAFDVGESVTVNVGRFAGQVSAVVALITDEYVDRHFTEIEVSTALANPTSRFVPVVVGGDPHPKTSRGRALWAVLRGRSFFRLDPQDPDAFGKLAHKLAHAGTGEFSGSAIRSGSPASAESEPMAGVTVVAYDWEDVALLEQVEDELAALGGAAAELRNSACVDLVVTPAPRVAVLWTDAASQSRDVARIAAEALLADTRVIYLVTADSPPAPAAETVRLSPRRCRSPAAAPAERDGARRDRRQLLTELTAKTRRLNDGVPAHVLTDKYCADRAAVRTARTAYDYAVHEIPAGAPERLVAVLDHAAVSRFYGEWSTAREVLAGEPLPNPTRSPLALALEAEQISLEFELGQTTGSVGRTNSLLARCLAVGEWPGIISAHRQLGMIYEEQGSYRNAREHLSLAFHYAEDLLDAEAMRERLPSRDARIALLVDCLRELAVLEWRSGGTAAASGRISEAAQTLRSLHSERLEKYLRAVVDCQRARIEFSVDRDYEKARAALHSSYLELQAFDNPIRLATVLESIVHLDMQFLRDSPAVAVLRSTLEKIHRVRSLRGHHFTIARARKAVGDLESSLCNWAAAREHYDAARQDFNRLGKQPEAADSARALGRCLANEHDADGAIAVLEDALENLKDSDQRSVRADIRSEMVRLLHQRVRPEDVDDSTEMTGVGEFSLHRWIAGDLRGPIRPPLHPESILLGVGDDCAVLRLGDEKEEGEEVFLVSTDSTPPALLRYQNNGGAAYAARFAVVSSLSDVLAMGGTPLALLMNLHVPREAPATWTRSLLQRAEEEARRCGAAIVGGDLKERPHTALTTVAVGRANRRRLLTRSAARPGQDLVITLSGGHGGCFEGMGRRWAHEISPLLTAAEKLHIADLIGKDAKFSDLGLPVEVMRDVGRADLARAAIDTSDGILACTQLITEASDVGVELDSLALNRLIGGDVGALAGALGIAPYFFALNAGHDWEVVFTSPRDRRDELLRLAANERGRFPRLAVIGEVVKRGTWSDYGVLLRRGVDRPKSFMPFFTDEKFVTSPYEERSGDWLDFARRASMSMGLRSQP
jgi:thiamin-phosphate kinase